MSRIELTFQSDLSASTEKVWAWATSVDGILSEMRPIARMTVPRGVENLIDADIELGRPLVRSWVLLFGILPIDRSDLTLIEMDVGHRFLEESPMLSMRLWRHERTIEPRPEGSRIRDDLTFEPRFAAPVVRWFVQTLFRNRHRVLRARLGGA